MPIIQAQPLPEVKRILTVGDERAMNRFGRTTRALGQRTIVLFPGDDVNEAINKLASEGDFGGVIFMRAGIYNLTANITGKTGISIQGEGIGKTILEFGGGAYGVRYIGVSGTELVNFTISNLTVQNSNAAAGIDIDYCDFWKMENVRVTSCDQNGVRIQRCQSYIMQNAFSDNNTQIGFSFFTDNNSDREHKNFSLINCSADTNAQDGFLFTYTSFTGTDSITNFRLVGCEAKNNIGDGFDFNGVSQMFNYFASIMGCSANNNTGNGFKIRGASMSFVGCDSTSNSADGFDINTITRGLSFMSCFASTNTTLDWDFTTSSDVTMIGCGIGGTLIQPSSKFYATNVRINSIGNIGGGTKTEKRTLIMNNNTGSQINQGDLVILASNSSGEVVATTTTAGDNRVFGVSLTNVSTGGWFPVLTEGFTTELKVDGTTDVNVGDFLMTSTTAGVAEKGTTGKICFAIALEAYSTNDANGVIDALIISPRQIA